MWALTLNRVFVNDIVSGAGGFRPTFYPAEKKKAISISEFARKFRKVRLWKIYLKTSKSIELSSM